MAWQRAYSSGFESRSLLEIKQDDYFVDAPLATLVNTGDTALSARNQVSSWGFAPPVTQARGSYYAYTAPFGTFGWVWLSVQFGMTGQFVAYAYDAGVEDSAYFDNLDATRTYYGTYSGGFQYNKWQAWGFVISTVQPDPFVTLYLDGRVVGRYTISLDTLGNPVGGIARISFGGTQTLGDSAIDDFYVDVSDSDDEPDAPPPSPRFYPAWPVGPGSVQDWTAQGRRSYKRPHHLLLRERPVEHDNSVVYTEDVDQTELFQIDWPDLPPGYFVQAMIPTAFAHGYLPDSPVRLVVRKGLDSLYSDDLAVSFGLQPLQARFALQPDATDWSVLSEPVEFGIET